MRTAKLPGILPLLAAACGPTFAQQSADAGADHELAPLQEIVVTATKRETTLQDVPVSVAVVGEDTLEQAQIRDLIDLQSVVPSLKVNQFNAVGQTDFIIR